MLSGGLKYALIVLAVGLLGYNSVYVERLSEYKSGVQKTLDVKAYAQEYLFKKVPQSVGKAVNIAELISRVSGNPKAVFNAVPESRRAGDQLYFLVKGEAEIVEVAEEYILLNGSGDSVKLKIATEYIFGNASRNAAGLISADQFDNTMDFNNVSEEINRLIRSQVLPPFKKEARKGDKVSFIAALEISATAPKLTDIELIPLKLVIKPH